MNETSYKSIWIAKYQRDREYYEKETEPFDGWENLARHGSMAEQYLHLGLYASYGNSSEAIADKFFRAAVKITDRAELEERFERGKYSSMEFPRNRGVALRARAYASALAGEALRTQDLARASLDFVEWCKSYSRREWDGQGQANYLAGVRTALIAGDKERFTSLLNYKWPFSYHLEESDLYRAMANEIREAAVICNDALRKKFRTLFDNYRDPEFKSDVFLEREIVRFELGVFWCRYFNALSDEFTWQSVVDTISY